MSASNTTDGPAIAIVNALQAMLDHGDASELSRLTKAQPVFSKGWVHAALARFTDQQQAKLKTLIDQFIDDCRNSAKVVTLIPVGGRGTRFAPFSWAEFKPFYPLFGKSNFLWSVERALATGRKPEDLVFFIESDMIERAKRELDDASIEVPSENFIPEIFGVCKGRNVTIEKAALFGMAAVYIAAQRGGDCVVVTERTDLVLRDPDQKNHQRLMRDLAAGIRSAVTAAALEPTIALLGNPQLPTDLDTPPDLNKGYILPHPKGLVDPMIEGLLAVDKFHEKPRIGEGLTVEETGEQIARRYLDNGATYNGSYFVFRADYLLDIYARTRPDDYSVLMSLRAAIGAEQEASVTRAAYDYFCSDSDRPARERRIYLSFEHAILPALAPVAGESTPFAAATVAVLSLDTARQWVGSQGTLKAVWPEEYFAGNYIRAEAYGGSEKAVSSGAFEIGQEVSACHLFIAPTDRHTRIHIFGATDLCVAYEQQKDALLVLPVSKTRAVSDLVAAVKSDPEIAPIADPRAKLPAALSSAGRSIVLNSSKVRIHCDSGLVAATDLIDVTIIKTRTGANIDIFVYGKAATQAAEKHLKRLDP